MDLITERAREIFKPLQLGFKTPNGCEAIVHAARQWFSRNCSEPGKVAISVDVSNAFNTIHSAAVLRAVRVHFPSLSPWVDCCYRSESTLFTGSSSVALQIIPSTRGVQQGDLLGPVLFSLAVHPAIAEARAATSSTTASVLVPPQPSTASLPLSLKASAASGSQSTWIRRKSSRHARPPNPSALVTSRGAPGTVLPTSSFLGAPVGSNEWCDELVRHWQVPRRSRGI